MNKEESKFIDRHIMYKDVFATENGKLVLNDMIERSGILKPSGKIDPTEILLEEGERRFMTKFLSFLTRDTEFYIKLMEERDARRAESEK